MRTLGILTAVTASLCAAIAVQPVTASADDNQSAQEVISQLQDQGYTVNIDRIGTGPMSECVVTNVRNPKNITQWVPYTGPGAKNDRVLVLRTISQSISVTLDCSRR